jgi:hypothetical protein
MFDCVCPYCGSTDLCVIAGRFYARGLRLYEDGFDFSEAKQIDTSDEVVECLACCKQFSLRERKETNNDG